MRASGVPERRRDGARLVAARDPEPERRRRPVERAGARRADLRRAPRAALPPRPDTRASPARARAARRAGGAQARPRGPSTGPATRARLPRGSLPGQRGPAGREQREDEREPERDVREREERQRQRERRRRPAGRRARRGGGAVSPSGQPRDRRAASRSTQPVQAAAASAGSTRLLAAAHDELLRGAPGASASPVGARRRRRCAGPASSAASSDGRRATLGVGVECAVDRVEERARQVGPDGLERRRAGADAPRGAGGVARAEGVLAGERLPEHDADRPHVGGRGRCPAVQPLGRDVGEGARARRRPA